MKTISRVRTVTVLILMIVLTTAASGTASAQPTGQPRLVDYTHDGTRAGVAVHSTADATKRLRGAPRSFKKFVGATADQLEAASTCTGEGYVGVTVAKVRSDGYAVGGVNDCGGYAALWAVVDGSWKQIAGTQESWDCRVLKKHRVPSAVVGDTCYAYHGDHTEHPYRQA